MAPPPPPAPGAPDEDDPPPVPPELEDELELEEDELELLEEELLLELDDELEPLDDELELLEEELEDEELELEGPVNSSAPMSNAGPVGRGSPSMSLARPGIVVPALTTVALNAARWRSHAVGSTNQLKEADVEFVEKVAEAPLSATMALLARLFRISAPVVPA